MRIPRISIDFKKVIDDLGTNLMIFYRDESGEISLVYNVKASLVPATEAAYNVTDREFLFKGDVILPNDFVVPQRWAGLYFMRDGIQDKKYMFLSVIEKPESKDVGTMYAVQCNEKVNLYTPVKYTDEYLNIKTGYKRTASDIDCYFTAVVRSPKIQNDGLLDQTIYSLQIPAANKITPMSRIGRMEYRTVEKTDEEGNTYFDNELKECFYQIDSVDQSLMRVDEIDGFISGVLVAQMSRDLRAAEIIE